MPEMAANMRVLVTLKGTILGQTTMTTFPMRIATVAAATSDVTFFAALNTKLNDTGGLIPLYLNCCPLDNFELDEVWYQILYPLRYRKTVFTLALPGTMDTQVGAPNLQASITRVGELARRRDIGGIRIPIGTGEEAVFAGLVSAGLEAQLEDVATYLGQVITLTTPAATLVHQVGITANMGTSVDVKQAFIQKTVRVLRRRTLRLGI